MRRWHWDRLAPLHGGHRQHADGLAEVGDDYGQRADVLGDALVHLALPRRLLDQRGPKNVIGWCCGLVLGVGVLLVLGEDLGELVRVGLGRLGELGAVFCEEVTKELGGARGVGFALGA